MSGMGGSGALAGPDARRLSVLADAPYSVEAAQTLFTELAERARRDDGFRAALEAWANQAAGHLTYESRGSVPTGLLRVSAVQERPAVEAHYSISGGAEDGPSQSSGAFASC
ncbi:hypothetical protein [Streptomyces sp. S.PNR 29]|uniref:hypothetical protein n=1 Tax=Streptomyces sp. S.PNR 29 TaxID=2973805 RepID=UPI0025B23A86|nr:hypothetical protein [Streptomyces sp. S.PNR 29]MDN0196559.1 hypothetical protein [Streptomyces sp. S.PNR 29]